MRNRLGLLVICLLLVSALPLVGDDEADNKSPLRRPASPAGKPAEEARLAQRIAELIEKLGDDDYFVRESASEELDKIGEPALESVKQALKESQDAEVRIRAKQLVEDIEWTQRIRNLPRTFGERYYKWLQGGKKTGYARLTIKEAKYQGQPVFKLQSQGVLPCPDRTSMKMEMTTYAQKNRQLRFLYGEIKGAGVMEFDLKAEVKDNQGHLTGQAKIGAMEITVDKMIKVPEDTISWEGLIIGATAWPWREGLSFHYSVFGLSGVEVKQLKTQPIRLVGEEEINFEGKKIKCHKFTTEIQRSHINFGGEMNFWIDQDRRLIKAGGKYNEFILTDKEDALKMPDQGKRKE